MICPSLITPLQLSSSFSIQNKGIFFSKECLFINKTWKHSMCLSLKVSVARSITKEGNFLKANNKNVLTNVPDNVVLTPWTDGSAFVGATWDEQSSRHVFNLGVLQEARLLCLYRFKLWWMIPRIGNSGSDVPIETQMLLLESKERATIDNEELVSYVLFLPVLDGEFRSSLQGNSAKELQVCVESGDPAVVTSESLKAVFVNSGNSPFDLVKESMKILEKHMGTFSLRETKKAS
ncbi:Galactinol--sucrose galactosyltransferase [Thalictrum thalictroides]|uniref:Galactinol--sucrose galactosyltransferase n=1 Tax=Thalictrum thalictroides TaxID=46969 RepID=A0A7J6XFP6_THATH|nr:Galactinol--sucrose galactosyltransferase [Thalictrum thalictroides]